jgi:hypothetical protein
MDDIEVERQVDALVDQAFYVLGNYGFTDVELVIPYVPRIVAI